MHVKGFEPEFIEQVYTCINSSLSAFQKHVGLKGRLTIREKVPNRIICSFSYIHHKTTKSNIYIYIYNTERWGSTRLAPDKILFPALKSQNAQLRSLDTFMCFQSETTSSKVFKLSHGVLWSFSFFEFNRYFPEKNSIRWNAVFVRL